MKVFFYVFLASMSGAIGLKTGIYLYCYFIEDSIIDPTQLFHFPTGVDPSENDINNPDANQQEGREDDEDEDDLPSLDLVIVMVYGCIIMLTYLKYLWGG